MWVSISPSPQSGRILATRDQLLKGDKGEGTTVLRKKRQCVKEAQTLKTIEPLCDKGTPGFLECGTIVIKTSRVWSEGLLREARQAQPRSRGRRVRRSRSIRNAVVTVKARQPIA